MAIFISTTAMLELAYALASKRSTFLSNASLSRAMSKAMRFEPLAYGATIGASCLLEEGSLRTKGNGGSTSHDLALA